MNPMNNQDTLKLLLDVIENTMQDPTTTFPYTMDQNIATVFAELISTHHYTNQETSIHEFLQISTTKLTTYVDMLSCEDKLLPLMLNDPDPIIRAIARHRLQTMESYT